MLTGRTDLAGALENSQTLSGSVRIGTAAQVNKPPWKIKKQDAKQNDDAEDRMQHHPRRYAWSDPSTPYREL